MTQEKESELQKKLKAKREEWEQRPPKQREKVIDTERVAIPVSTNISASEFDFELKEGNTTYEVVGHFNPDASENLLQKILRMLRE